MTWLWHTCVASKPLKTFHMQYLRKQKRLEDRGGEGRGGGGGSARADEQGGNDAAAAASGGDCKLTRQTQDEEDDGEHEHEGVEAAFAAERAHARGNRSRKPLEAEHHHSDNDGEAAGHDAEHEKRPARLDCLFARVVLFDAVCSEPLGGVVAEVDEEHDLHEEEDGGAEGLGGGVLLGV